MARRPRDHKPLKERARGIFRTKYTCCGKTMHSNRAQKAHHLAEHSGRWSSDQARKIARKIGKTADRARRHALGWQEAAGLRDARGKLTARGRSRPRLRGHLKVRDLRHASRHDKQHERADRHTQKAARARARDRHDIANARERKARDLRGRWPELRHAPPARPAAPRARSNGTRSNGTRPRTRTP